MQKRKYKKGHKSIYNEPADGLSFYPTTGEIYHTNRSKSKFHRFYLEAIKGRKSFKVLDIGCYTGTEIFMLPKPNNNGKYWGVDVSTTAIRNAKSFSKQRGESNIVFQVSDANKPLAFPKKYFDVVYALELVEHLKEPSVFFQDVGRVLKDDGYLIISTPNEGTFLNKLSIFIPGVFKSKLSKAREKDFSRHGNSTAINSDVWDEDAHISLWSYSKWSKVIKSSGFDLEQVEGSSFYGGSRYTSERPFLLGCMILLDSIIDLLPFKPHLQMCMILKLKKKK